MNSPIKFLFLPTIDVIFLLTLPDTRTLLVAHLPAQLPWAINTQHWAQQSHHSPVAAAPFKGISFTWGSFTAGAARGDGKVGMPKEVGTVGSGKDHPGKEVRLVSPGSGPWQLSLRHRRASPAAALASSAQNHTLFCVNALARGVHLLVMLPTWNTGNELNVFTLTYPNFK